MDQQAAPPVNEEQLRALLARFDVNNLVVPSCIVCTECPARLEVIDGCGHTVCEDCKRQLTICPICRDPIILTVTLNTGAMRFAWRSDLAGNFGVENIVSHPDLDGHRPGDTTIAQDLERMSEELARELAADERGLQDDDGNVLISGHWHGSF